MYAKNLWEWAFFKPKHGLSPYRNQEECSSSSLTRVYGGGQLYLSINFKWSQKHLKVMSNARIHLKASSICPLTQAFKRWIPGVWPLCKTWWHCMSWVRWGACHVLDFSILFISDKFLELPVETTWALIEEKHAPPLCCPPTEASAICEWLHIIPRPLWLGRRGGAGLAAEMTLLLKEQRPQGPVLELLEL